MENDFVILPLGDQPAPRKLAKSEVVCNWESFSAYFTQEFEWLKSEVDGLRSEVKSLRKIVKEMKVRNTLKGQGQGKLKGVSQEQGISSYESS